MHSRAFSLNFILVAGIFGTPAIIFFVKQSNAKHQLFGHFHNISESLTLLGQPILIHINLFFSGNEALKLAFVNDLLIEKIFLFPVEAANSIASAAPLVQFTKIVTFGAELDASQAMEHSKVKITHIQLRFAEHHPVTMRHILGILHLI